MVAKIIDRDRGFKAFVAGLRRIQGRQVVAKVGISEPEANLDHGGITNVALGAIHEFGAPSVGVPSRSFIRATYDRNRGRYEKLLREGAERGLKGRFRDPKALVFQAGEELRADIIDRIDSGIGPPLKPATIARKGDSLPLVDTGVMRNAITVKLEIK